MHTIDLLEEALQLASDGGWQVRHEWLGGARGGACRLGGKHMLFVDRSLTASEQLEQVLEGLRRYLETPGTADPFAARFTQTLSASELSAELKRCLGKA
jgi:hypothetical protein